MLRHLNATHPEFGQVHRRVTGNLPDELTEQTHSGHQRIQTHLPVSPAVRRFPYQGATRVEHMPSVRDIRRRIRSVENTGKVTNAMSLIAASKMRRAQLGGDGWSPLRREDPRGHSHCWRHNPPATTTWSHPLLQVRPVNNVGMVVITPDRGLAGGMHANNQSAAWPSFILNSDAIVRSIVVGRKGRDFLVRYTDTVQAVFTDLNDRVWRWLDTTPISRLVIDGYSLPASSTRCTWRTCGSCPLCSRNRS